LRTQNVRTETHCAYPLRNGQAGLAWLAAYAPRTRTVSNTINILLFAKMSQVFNCLQI